jgi:hypothetical protein
MGDSLLWGGAGASAQFCLRAFLRLEVYRLQTGVSWDDPPGGHPPFLGSSSLSQLRNS